MRPGTEQNATTLPVRRYLFDVRLGSLQSATLLKNLLGFTLVEMVMVMVIVGVLAAVVVPRFFDRGTFDNSAFSNQVKGTLRLAQKLAIAQHRNVCVNVTTATPAGLTINVTKTASCDTPLPSLSGSGNYQVSAPGSATLTSSAATITFNALGSPGAADITLQVGTEPVITVTKETGYVY